MLSIIIPVYNNENGIIKTIQSIKQIKFSDYEVIIVNDGSNDNTEECINLEIFDDSRFKLFSNTNHGVSYSRNYGVLRSSGEYITFIDSGDTITADSYEYLKILPKDIDVVLFELDRIENENHITKPIPFNGLLLQDDIVNELMPMFLAPLKKDKTNEPLMGSACRLVIKKELLATNSILFLEDLKVAEDLIFCLDVLKNAKKLFCIKKSYYNYIREANTSIEKYREDIWENSMHCEKQLLKIFTSICNKDIYSLRFKVFQFYQCTWALSNLNRDFKKVKDKKSKNRIIREYFKSNILGDLSVFRELSISRKLIYILLMFNLTFLINCLFVVKEKVRISRFN